MECFLIYVQYKFDDDRDIKTKQSIFHIKHGEGDAECQARGQGMRNIHMIDVVFVFAEEHYLLVWTWVFKDKVANWGLADSALKIEIVLR